MPKNNINERLPDGSTILHNAVKAGNERTISLLVQQGHSVHIEDAQGKKPLDYAPTEQIKKMLITAMQVDQTLIYSNADKYFNYLKNTYIKTELDKEKAIDMLLSDPTIELDVLEVVMQKILNYNVNSNNEVATPAEVAPIAAPVEVTQTVTTTTTSVASTATTIVPSEASMQALNAIKARLLNHDSIEDIIASLDHYDIEDAVKNILIQHIFDNVNGNNTLTTPTEETPVAATTVEPVIAISSSEGELSANIKVRLYNGETKEDLINFVFLYQDISDDARANLITEICEYSFGTELAGQIGTDIQF